MKQPKAKYPRMQLRRNEWMNLNGEWDFAFDDDNIGLQEKWYKKERFDKKIIVPFAFQTKLSQINDTGFHDHVWYMKKFKLDSNYSNKKVLIHFGAVDYECIVYLNNEMVGSHKGGHIGFSIDITNYLAVENKLVVYVYDPSTDERIPRGKQFWKKESQNIWYTRTTGIWQTVWLEPLEQVHITEIKMTPDIDRGEINMEIRVNKVIDHLKLATSITLHGESIQTSVHSMGKDFIKFTLDVFRKEILKTSFHMHGACWSPESPTLFDVIFELSTDVLLDRAESYFGMRKIHTENGMVYLNNKRYFQKLVLDQGYWKDSLLTAPSDQALIDDIENSKKMGFNGCRKHQKVEEERFLYWADKLGYLVWGEMPSGISYDDNYISRITLEWMEILKRDYNHPSIITWVPLNESWGIPNVNRMADEKSHSLSMYYLTHSIDHTRLVISNDGWEMTKSDICAIHNYNHGDIENKKQHDYFQESLRTKENIMLERPSGRAVFVDGFDNQTIPFILSEFGGIAFNSENGKNWGYSNVSNEQEFLEEYRRILEAIYSSEVIDGFCYTQFTDVEYEINGLLTYNRKAKFDFQKIKEINDLYFMKSIKGSNNN